MCLSFELNIRSGKEWIFIELWYGSDFINASCGCPLKYLSDLPEIVYNGIYVVRVCVELFYIIGSYIYEGYHEFCL